MKLSTRIRNTVGAAAFTLAIVFSGSIVNTPSTYAAGSIDVGAKAVVSNTDGDNIRVRGGAGSQFDQVAEAHQGDVVSVLAGPKQDTTGFSWWKVDAPGGTGWIRSDFLAAKGSATAAASSSSGPAKLSGYARVANTDGDTLRLRKAPNGAVVDNLAPNTVVVIKQGPVADSTRVLWYQISVDGVTGWAMGEYLASAPVPTSSQQAKVVTTAKPAAPAPAPAPAAPAPAPAAQQTAARSGVSRGAQPPAAAPSSSGGSIVSVAMRYIGYRYRFGGTTPAGFDCSGFLYYVVNHAGIGISRDMYSQYNSGTHVSSNNLQPGDLLFFSNTYKRGLSHAGIYIGNGKFVHAENESTGVTVSALWSAYWASHYTSAVRVR